MQEDFLHYVWKYQKLNSVNLKTTDGESIIVSSVGQHNFNSGPDFFNSKVTIDNQLWAGNVEIHIKSSDWYVHNHENDVAYDNVILHVVWEHDAEIYRKNNTLIPTLEIKDLVNGSVLINYQKLMSNKDKFINCQSDFHSVDDFVLEHWLERLFIERLERKSTLVFKLLKESNNDWEAVLFKMLAKSFGLKVNADAFLSMSKSFDFSTLRKIQGSQLKLEALFFGQLKMLDVDEPYSQNLKREYEFLQNKFKLNNQHIIPVKFFRLRPPNFPTIRLSQLATLYSENSNLFSQLQNLGSIEEIRSLLDVGTSTFWETHYSFSKDSGFARKKLTKSFIDLLIINALIPVRFCYFKSMGISNISPILNLASSLSAEKNSVVDGFTKLRDIPDAALSSQALINLKTNYCDNNKCLHCEIGNKLINN